jgi:glycosyltransferase involved in cell wall biosynthesis
MARISIIYHHFPHYRAPVLRALAQSNRHEYRFFAGKDDFQGIKAFRGDNVVTVEPITFRFSESRGTTDIADFDQAVSPPFDATIILGNPNMMGAWLAVWRARRNGLKTAFWAHGWTRKEGYLKSKIRNFFFSRADHVLSYGTRAIKLAARTGFDPTKISVIWNSLDWDAQSALFRQYSGVASDALRTNIGMPRGVPMIGTISRVTAICHYEWLIDAVAGLRQNGTMAEVWMIGDGPVLEKLAAQAKEKGVPLHTLGAIYDEASLAQHIMAVDCIASPGKVGLTAMHALAYGTPVVSHSDFDRQMPEVEAILEGKSGAFFEYGSVLGLQTALAQVFAYQGDLDARRSDCRASLEGRFTPQDQVRLIDDAMDRLINGKT